MQRLLPAYGDAAPAQVQTRLRHRGAELYAGSETELYAALRVLDARGRPVSGLAPAAALGALELLCNGAPLPGLAATARVGEFRARFTPAAENALAVRYGGRCVAAARWAARATFLPAPGARLEGRRCTALAHNVLVTVAEPLRGGRGRVALRFSGPALCGFARGGRTHLAPVDGRVELAGLGEALRIETRPGAAVLLPGLGGEDAFVCVQLRRDRVCELLD